MESIGIISSGCLISSKFNVFSNDKHVIFASSLAVYVLNGETFALEKVIPVADRTLIAISINPNNHNELLATALDGFLSFWHIEEEECVNRVCLEPISSGGNDRPGIIPANRFDPPHFLIAWDPFTPDMCAVVLTFPTIRILQWNATKASELTELYGTKNQTVGMSVAAYNPHVRGILACGCSNGSVLLLNLLEGGKGTQRMLQVADRTSPVVDLQWDRLSSIYLLVAYQTFVSLWDSETCTEIHTFEKQSSGITAIAWLDWTAGNFVSTNSKNGILKIWNASQRQQPLQSIRVANSGILSIHFGAGNKRAVCGCFDGSVVVYHMGKQQLEYSTAAGHTETIFDCCFSPQSPDVLATCSYDRTVKLWGVSDLALQKTLHNSNNTAKSIIYRISWSPRGNAITACTSDGMVLVWDTSSGREVARYASHAKSAYCVAWNKLNESLLASVSGDHCLVVLEVDLAALLDPANFMPVTSVLAPAKSPTRTPRGLFSKQATAAQLAAASQQQSRVTESTVALRFVHPASVFGCAWSEHERDVLATCCRDHLVRVFDCSRRGGSASQSALIHVLKGHNERAFCAVWSPLVSGLVASGSDDAVICLWSVNLDEQQETDQVRTTHILRIFYAYSTHILRIFYA